MEETIGTRIRAMREVRKLSQQAVADYVGVSRVAVTKWESGSTANLKFPNLVRLVNLFSVTFDELIVGSPKPSFSAEAVEAAKIIDGMPGELRVETLHRLRVFSGE